MRKISVVLSFIFFLGASCWEARATTPGGTRPGVAIRGGLIHISAPDMPLKIVLEELSLKAGIQIFLFDKISGQGLPQEIEAYTLENALKVLLKGHSYAILYSRPDIGHGKAKVVPSEKGLEGSVSLSHETRVHEFFPSPVLTKLTENPRRVQQTRATMARAETSRANSDDHHTAKNRFTAQRPASGIAQRPASAIGPEHGSVTGPVATAASTQTAQSNSQKSQPGTAPENPAGVTPGSVQMYASSTSDPTELTSSSPSGAVPAAANPRDIYSGIIQTLEQRISSGLSDTEYERWVAVRGEQYVIHDREKLAYYKKRLLGN